MDDVQMEIVSETKHELVTESDQRLEESITVRTIEGTKNGQSKVLTKADTCRRIDDRSVANHSLTEKCGHDIQGLPAKVQTEAISQDGEKMSPDETREFLKDWNGLWLPKIDNASAANGNLEKAKRKKERRKTSPNYQVETKTTPSEGQDHRPTKMEDSQRAEEVSRVERPSSSPENAMPVSKEEKLGKVKTWTKVRTVLCDCSRSGH